MSTERKPSYTIRELTEEEAKNWVQIWESQIPEPTIDNPEAMEQILDNVAYILRRTPFYLGPDQFADPLTYLRPEYQAGASGRSKMETFKPSFDWDMLDVVDLVIELQKKFPHVGEIPDEVMYLDFLQLRDVYNWLYIHKDDKKTESKTEASGKAAEKPSNAALIMFPGQGAQKLGMGQKVVELYPEARALFDKAKDILGYDLLEICINGPDEKLQETVISQPALYVSSMAGLIQLEKENPEIYQNAVATCGLSLGEYTALAFAGSLSFEDGLRLVQARAEAMQDASTQSESGMVSVLGTGLTEAKVSELVAEAARNTNSKCYVSNLLCAGNTVVSGSLAACDELVRLAPSYGATKTIKLKVAAAYHSEYMRPAYAKLREALQKADIKKPRIPVVFNVDAEPEDNVDKIREKMLEQLVKPVQWERSVMYCLRHYRLATIVEVGAGNVLTGLARRILKSSELAEKPALKKINV